MRRWLRRRRRPQLVFPVPVVGPSPRRAAIAEAGADFLFGSDGFRLRVEDRGSGQPPMYMYCPTLPRRDITSAPVTYEPSVARRRLLSHITNGRGQPIEHFEIEDLGQIGGLIVPD